MEALVLQIIMTINQKRIESIINAYKKLRTQHPDIWLTDCASSENLYVAIQRSATARNAVGKKHSHQHRIPNTALEEFAAVIQERSHELQATVSFGEILALVGDCRVKGISELTIYDASQRLGCFLNLFPEEIYLHSGTRKGAEILLGKLRNKSITIGQLPEPFWNDLSPAEIEDILCIYKDRLAKCYNRLTFYSTSCLAVKLELKCPSSSM